MKLATIAILFMFAAAGCDDDKRVVSNNAPPHECPDCPAAERWDIGTAVWDGHTLAVSDNRIYVGNGVFVAAVGDIQGDGILSAIASGINPTGSWRAIIIGATQAWVADSFGRVEVIRDQNLVLGTGDLYAWNAVKMNVDAVSAVSFAITQDPHSNGPVASVTP